MSRAGVRRASRRAHRALAVRVGWGGVGPCVPERGSGVGVGGKSAAGRSGVYSRIEIGIHFTS